MNDHTYESQAFASAGLFLFSFVRFQPVCGYGVSEISQHFYSHLTFIFEVLIQLLKQHS